MAAHDALFAASGAGVEISVSGLAQANCNRPLEPLYLLLQQVLEVVVDLSHRRLRALDKATWRGIVHLLQRPQLFDATTFTLLPKVRTWAAGQQGRAALKVHLRLNGWSGAFKQVLVTPATGNDSAYFTPLLGELDATTEQIFVFDAGYLSLDTYHAMAQSGNHFVTRCSRTLKPRIMQERPLADESGASGYRVVQDALVYLGENQTHRYR